MYIRNTGWDFELYNNIQQVSILNKKGLYEQANKLLKKTSRKFLPLAHVAGAPL